MDNYDEIAADIYDWGQTAVFDMVGVDEADEAWDDPDSLQDIFGDRIFDAANRLDGGCKVHFIALCNAMKQVNKYHTALKSAMDRIITRQAK